MSVVAKYTTAKNVALILVTDTGYSLSRPSNNGPLKCKFYMWDCISEMRTAAGILAREGKN